VRENVHNFGGNPDKILIYGQSGGGSKVTSLLGMPSAKGLIQRAIIQSGGGGNIPDAAQSREFSRQLLKELGIGPKDLTALQKMQWPALFAAGNRAADHINGPVPFSIRTLIAPDAKPTVGWNPTLDGRVINVRSYFDSAPEVSKDVPVIIGNVSEEGMSFGHNPTEAQWRTELGQFLSAPKADALIAAMKRAHPEKAIRTLAYGVDGLYVRNHVQDMVRMKHAQRGAAVYQYLFQWQSPQLDSVAGAWHTAELAFCFDNTRRCEQGTGDTPEAQALAKKMARAWSNFAHVGNPGQPGLDWTASDPQKCQTLVFDDQCGMKDDPEGAVRRILI
jgi:para-nitrobenzyl esterase